MATLVLLFTLLKSEQLVAKMLLPLLVEKLKSLLSTLYDVNRLAPSPLSLLWVSDLSLELESTCAYLEQHAYPLAQTFTGR